MENLFNYDYTSMLYKLQSLKPQLLKQAEDYISLLYNNQQNIIKHEIPEKLPLKAGFAKDFFIMKDDFDEPLEDFKEYMQ